MSCINRLRQLHRKLKGDEHLLCEYNNVIKQQTKDGIVERVLDQNEPDEGTYYLPHHGVIRSDKETTKLRVVFDGSAKPDNTNLSINECLETGPNLVPHLFDVIIKFRGYPIAMVADIEKAFHQVLIAPEDRRMQRFLWFDDVNKDNPEIVKYQFCRLPFGLTSSPAILSLVLQHHFDKHQDQAPDIVPCFETRFTWMI